MGDCFAKKRLAMTGLSSYEHCFQGQSLTGSAHPQSLMRNYRIHFTLKDVKPLAPG
jgi:hypothetical protein